MAPPTRRGRLSLKIKIYHRWEDVVEIRPQWNALLAQSTSDSFFLTWDWLDAWWKSYGENRPTFLVTGWIENQLVGVAPFYLDRERRWGSEYRVLRLVGDGSNDSDYLDCFTKGGREREFMDGVVHELRSQSREWDWMDIHTPAECSSSLSALVEVAKLVGWRLSEVERIPCVTLALPKSWDEYQAILKTRFRSTVKSAVSFAQDKLELFVEQCERHEALAPWLSDLFELHTRRWSTRDLPGVFRGEKKREFYREVSSRALANGTLAFHRLAWAGRPLALQYGFTYSNRFHLLQEGYDPDFDGLRPGLVLRASLLRRWIECGMSEYDFLAGASAYKLDWGGQVKYSVRIQVAHSARCARVAIDVPEAIERAKGTIRESPLMSVVNFQRKLTAGGKKRKANKSGPNNGFGLRRAALAAYRPPLSNWLRDLSIRFERTIDGGIHQRTTPICHIIYYHRVNDSDDAFFAATPVEVFREQIRYLARNFSIVSLDDIAKGRFGESTFSVAITFDDGYRDNFLYAFPILKELGLPATIFLATDYIGSGEIPWYDQVCLACKLTQANVLDMTDSGGPLLNLTSSAQRLSAAQKLLPWLRSLSFSDRKESIQRILVRLKTNVRLAWPNMMLDWSEVRQMAKQGITFGGHTKSHPVLSSITGNHLRDEVGGSKKKIESMLQTSVAHFAYPFGKYADVGNEAKQAVIDAGFETAVTTENGFNVPSSDLFALRRFTPWESDIRAFAMKMDWYRFYSEEFRNNSAYGFADAADESAKAVLSAG